MKKDKWKKKIEEACKEAKTYKPYFDGAIDTLAQILETRDIAHEQWVEEGCVPTVEHTNKGGNTNITKNPLLTLENDLNSQALAYWREIGLTIKSFHTLDKLEKTTEGMSFEDLLNDIADG